MSREDEVRAFLSRDEILQQLMLQGGASTTLLTLASIRKNVVQTSSGGADTYPAWKYDSFQAHWLESSEYLACLLNTVRLASEKGFHDRHSPVPEPFKPSLSTKEVTYALANRVRARTFALWLQRGHTIAETVGELIWHLATHLKLWPLIVNEDGHVEARVDFDHVRIRLSDWLFYFADDLELNGARLVSTSFENWVPVGWSSEEAEASWTTESLAAEATAQSTGKPVLVSFSGYREFYERRNAELVAGYSFQDSVWRWTSTNGTPLVSAMTLHGSGNSGNAEASLLDDRKFAEATERYFGEFKTGTSLPDAEFAGAAQALCFSMSIVTAPLDNERPQLGAFAFGTVLLDARRGGRAHHVSLPSLTEDLWRSMNLLKLPMVKQLAREQRVEAELQRDMAALYHRKFVAIQPEVRRAATIIDQLQRSSSRINVHISTPKDGLFGADTGIRRLFSPSVTLNLVTLPKPIRASHTAEYEECGDLSGNQVAMAVLAHLLSMARGAGHTNADQKHEKLKPAATYRQGGKRAPERALEMEWAHLWTEMGHSPFLKAICLLVAPPFALFLAGEELKSSGERILTSLKGDPSTALLRAKRRLLKPLKEEFSWEPVSLESIPLFVENCVLMNAGGLEATLEKADPYETLPLDTIAWSLKGEFANEWLFDFVSEFCKAFGGRTSRWVAETRVFQNNRRGLDVRFAIPSSENLQGLGAALRNATTSEQDCVFPKPSALRTGGEGDVIEPIAVLLSRAPAHADHGEHANFYKGGSELSLTYRSFTLTITPQGFQIVERAEQEQEGEDG